MSSNPKQLSATARALLTAAAMHDDHLIRPPQLPIAAARQVVRSLLNSGLAEEVQASIEAAEYAWRTAYDGVVILRATAFGLGRFREAESTTLATDATGTVIDAAVPAVGGGKLGHAASPRRHRPRVNRPPPISATPRALRQPSEARQRCCHPFTALELRSHR